MQNLKTLVSEYLYYFDVASLPSFNIMDHNRRDVHHCGSKENYTHLGIDEACLKLVNSDVKEKLTLWAQASECYKCPPWKYITVSPKSTAYYVMNATYPTSITIRNDKTQEDQHTNFHFEEYGEYRFRFNSTHLDPLLMTHKGHDESLAVFIALALLLCLAIFWHCGKSLLKRMDESIPALRSENAPLLSSRHKRGLTYSQIFNESNPGPSTSTDTTTDTLLVNTQLQPTPPAPATSSRLKSLDTFRGLAITLMIFVNYGGGKYYYFKHARWNGLTVADLVFPWFMWIMGVSMTFSIRSQLKKEVSVCRILLSIFRRSVILFFLGIIINSNGHNYFPQFRIFGVLQRFGFCYLINATLEAIFMSLNEATEEGTWKKNIRDLIRSLPQWLCTIAFVIIHTCLTFALPVPGCPKGYLGPGGLHENGQYMNCTGGAAGYIDRVVLGRNHIYGKPTCQVVYDSVMPFDPEGILGILTSCLMVQFGVAAGRIIFTYKGHSPRVTRWVLWALATGLLAGFLCGWSKETGLIPVNKNLWSLSYVLTTSCFAFVLLSIMYILIDVLKYWEGRPLSFVGMNAIFLYMGHEICGGLFPWSWSPVGQYHYQYLYMNIWGTGLWIFTAYYLHTKQVYFSI